MPARNHVAERIHELLTERRLVPGDRLPPERQLAAELGVSRSSLREGLRRLLDVGVLQARQGSGTYLAPVDLADLLEARLRLEPYAARLAARHREDGHIRQLDDVLAELRATAGDPVAFAAADQQLHAIVTEASGSLALRVLLAALGDLLRHSRSATSSDPDVRAATLVRLEQLAAALRDGDASAAEQAMRAHLREIGTAVQV